MCCMEFRRIVDFVQDPAGRIIDMLADVESPASRVAGHRLPGIVQKQPLEFRERLRPDRHEDEDDVSVVDSQLPTSSGETLPTPNSWLKVTAT